MRFPKNSLSAVTALAGLLLSTAVAAHNGTGVSGGFVAGFLHPLGGLDHLLAMIAVGLWAGQLRGRAYWSLPLAFAAAMSVGGAAGWVGIELLLAEEAILASAMLFGVLVAGDCRPSLFAACVLAGFFALFHGWAHGVEMPPAADVAGYASGFALATLSVIAGGILLGQLLRSTDVVRAHHAGGAIASVALLLAVVGHP